MNPDNSPPLNNGGPTEPPTSQTSDLNVTQSQGSWPQPLSISGMIAWAFVTGLTLFLFSIVAYSQLMTESKIGGDATSTDLMQIQLQGKTLVGQDNLMGQPGPAVNPQPTILPPALDTGPYEQRLCYSILVNELKSPTEAKEYLANLDQAVKTNQLELTQNQERLRQILLTLLERYEQGDLDSNSLPESDRQFLESKLQWLGKLALVPAGTPQKSERSRAVQEAVNLLVTGIVGMLFAVCIGFTGVILAIVFIVLLASGKLRSGFFHQVSDHNIYIETFALWMAIFFGGSIALGFFEFKDPRFVMLVQPFVFFGSLVALVWPIVRGIPFPQVRRDIGWRTENLLKETLAAVPAYLATLPFLVPGIALISILMMLVTSMGEQHEFARQVIPSHPVQDYIMSGGVPMLLLVFLTACVAAPVVEETMFRGVLYRHLREWTGRRQRWISVIVSSVFNGLIFASIHPQGIFGIPVLTILAIGFSLTREWRGSVVSPMIMHGIHNTLVTCISLMFL